MTTEILICGFGGQGVIFAAELIGRAGVLAGLEAAESAAYGAEARGSACHAGIILSEALIAYPKVRRPDLLIALSQAGYDKFVATVKPGGRAVYDKDLVKSEESSVRRNDTLQVGVSATTAATKLGRRGVANVVITAAALSGLTAVGSHSYMLLPLDALERAIVEQSPGAFREINIRALAEGWMMGLRASLPKR